MGPGSKGGSSSEPGASSGSAYPGPPPAPGVTYQ
jgi:hypothetical protein